MTTRDLPDYIQETVIRYTGGFIGLEELAARLGSIVPWDMKGNIVLAENFESELTEWVDGSVGGLSAAQRSSRRKFSGDWSVKLFVDDVADAGGIITRDFYYPGATKLTIFAMFGFDDTVQMLSLPFRADNGLTAYGAVLRYIKPATELAYLDEDGNYQAIDSALDLGRGDFAWYPFRLDIDLSTGYYLKAYVGHKEYDLSTYALQPLDSGGLPFSEVSAENGAVAATGSTAYVDSIIVAKNVP